MGWNPSVFYQSVSRRTKAKVKGLEPELYAIFPLPFAFLAVTGSCLSPTVIQRENWRTFGVDHWRWHRVDGVFLLAVLRGNSWRSG